MKALLVYESMFGNTEQIARSVAEGLARRLPVETVRVGDAPLTLGSRHQPRRRGWPDPRVRPQPGRHPRGTGPERANGSVVTHGRGLRDWLEALHVGASGVAAAAFDTRVNRPRLPGSAARAADRQMRRQGMHPIVVPHSFHVRGTTGPVVDGESDQARRWGEQVAVELLHGLARTRG